MSISNRSIASLLPRGEANAVSTAELVRLTGAKSARDLQVVIAAERADGALILSTCRRGGGYYLPAEGEQGRAELLAFTRTLDSRAKQTIKALRSARRALRTVDGQLGV